MLQFENTIWQADSENGSFLKTHCPNFCGEKLFKMIEWNKKLRVGEHFWNFGLYFHGL